MREGDIGMQLGEIAKANPMVAISSYPFFDPQLGPIRMSSCAPAIHRSSRLQTRGRGHAGGQAQSS
jgi:hypothetical protein